MGGLISKFTAGQIQMIRVRTPRRRIARSLLRPALWGTRDLIIGHRPVRCCRGPSSNGCAPGVRWPTPRMGGEADDS
jgi:hypothetical protein